jgi:hypothetical protein
MVGRIGKAHRFRMLAQVPDGRKTKLIRFLQEVIELPNLVSDFLAHPRSFRFVHGNERAAYFVGSVALFGDGGGGTFVSNVFEWRQGGGLRGWTIAGGVTLQLLLPVPRIEAACTTPGATCLAGSNRRPNAPGISLALLWQSNLSVGWP